MGKIMYRGVDYSAPTASGVSGVKGAKENSYRVGNVNITPENIGAPTAEEFNAFTPYYVGGGMHNLGEPLEIMSPLVYDYGPEDATEGFLDIILLDRDHNGEYGNGMQIASIYLSESPFYDYENVVIKNFVAVTQIYKASGSLCNVSITVKINTVSNVITISSSDVSADLDSVSIVGIYFKKTK